MEGGNGQGHAGIGDAMNTRKMNFYGLFHLISPLDQSRSRAAQLLGIVIIQLVADDQEPMMMMTNRTTDASVSLVEFAGAVKPWV